MRSTLLAGISEEGRGGLTGRYRDEVKAHLEAISRRDDVEGHVFWDWENMYFRKVYNQSPHGVVERVLKWLSGVIDAPITKLEAVEFTRYETTPQFEYLSGERNWLSIARQMGATVHRAWPRMKDAADVVLLDRMRTFLEKREQGGPDRIMVVLSSDKGFLPMMHAAQSEGVTAIVVGGDKEARYFPGGSNFSVPFRIPNWVNLERELMNRDRSIIRPPEQWMPWQGPHRWVAGTLALQPPAPGEELDRRVFHEWMNRSVFAPRAARHDGSWSRGGVGLNDTLAEALRRALARTGSVGTRTGALLPEVREALERDLADMGSRPEDSAAVFWNFEDMRLVPQGPPQYQMLGRMTRWFEGYLGLPVHRVEVSRFVEPWEKFGAYGLDWLYHMKNIGMVVHRIWPPREEKPNMMLLRSVAAFAQMAAGERGDGNAGDNRGPRRPRLVCFFSEDLYFDHHVRDAQRAGISTLWFGKEQRAIYYPANCNATIRIEVLPWELLTFELSMSLRSPFTPGAPRPDVPAAAFRKPAVPADPSWGRPDDVELDSSLLKIPVAILQQSTMGVSP